MRPLALKSDIRMVPADVVLCLISFAVTCVSELPTTVTSIRAVHRNWNVYVFKTAARLFFTLPYDLDLVSNRINYVPPMEKALRYLHAADREMPFRLESELAEFIPFVYAQILLANLRTRTHASHNFYMGEMLDVFVCVVAEVLNERHPFVEEGIVAINKLDMSYDEFLEINIGDDIVRMKTRWRDCRNKQFCLAALVDVFMRNSSHCRVKNLPVGENEA